MADNMPGSPEGAVPPKPAEAAKVQPKKETVRINLPPKPTAAPNIKIPAPSAAGAAARPAAPAPPPAPAAAAPAAAPAPAPRPVAAAPTAPRATPAPRAPVVQGVSGLDTGLAVAAAVLSIAALVILLII
jgi:hypothetical protein